MIWYPLGVKCLAISIDFGMAVKVSSPGLVDYGISLNTFLIIFALSYFLLQLLHWEQVGPGLEVL